MPKPEARCIIPTLLPLPPPLLDAIISSLSPHLPPELINHILPLVTPRILSSTRTEPPITAYDANVTNEWVGNPIGYKDDERWTTSGMIRRGYRGEEWWDWKVERRTVMAFCLGVDLQTYFVGEEEDRETQHEEEHKRGNIAADIRPYVSGQAVGVSMKKKTLEAGRRVEMWWLTVWGGDEKEGDDEWRSRMFLGKALEWSDMGVKFEVFAADMEKGRARVKLHGLEMGVYGY